MRWLPAILLPTLCFGALTAAPPAAVEKVTEHFYLYQPSAESWNVGLFVTDEALLIVDPPPPADAEAMATALRKISAKPVRWIVHTSYRRELDGSADFFARQGAVILGSTALRKELHQSEPKDAKPSGNPLQRLSFGGQVRLWPAGFEIRVFALQSKARTGGDVAVAFPAEKVLLTGDLYAPASFPEIDTAADGSAAGWVDGLKQVADSIPLLKQAIPQPKVEKPRPPAPGQPPEEEKTLEELVTVVPGHGPISNLKEVKELLEIAHKMKVDVTRMVAAGRNRRSILASPSLSPGKGFANFESFCELLVDSLGAKP
jgi:glyoxylase-like metal-dependent hydrolase (beta-lactamase superfamily II)